MKHLEVVYDLTKQIDDELKKAKDTKNRESVIEQVNDLIEQRGISLQKVRSPYTEQEKVLGHQIVKLNSRIEEQMNALFNELKVEMKQFKKKRQSNRSYINPYENIQTTDGMFLDSKK